MPYSKSESLVEIQKLPATISATLQSGIHRGQSQLYAMYDEYRLVVCSASMVALKPEAGQTWQLKPDYTPNGLVVFCSLVPASAAETPAQLALKADMEKLSEVAGGIDTLKLCIRTASRQLGLSKAQVDIFINNTPGGKKGNELWVQYTRRHDSSREPEAYNFCTFVREVLAEAGYPYTGPAN